jgi:hypothetical protein
VERIVEKEVLVDKVIEVRAQEEGRVLILRAWEGRMRHDVYVRRMCVCPCILFMAWYASIHTRIRKRTYVYAQKCMSVYLFIHVCTCDANGAGGAPRQAQVLFAGRGPAAFLHSCHSGR